MVSSRVRPDENYGENFSQVAGFYSFLDAFLPEEYKEDLNCVADYDSRTRGDAT